MNDTRAFLLRVRFSDQTWVETFYPTEAAARAALQEHYGDNQYHHVTFSEIKKVWRWMEGKA